MCVCVSHGQKQRTEAALCDSSFTSALDAIFSPEAALVQPDWSTLMGRIQVENTLTPENREVLQKEERWNPSSQTAGSQISAVCPLNYSLGLKQD